MLQSMRTLAQSWIVKGLMGFLIISFSVWGIGDIFRGNPLQKTVASVGNVDISVQQLNRIFEQALTVARQKVSPTLTPQQARQMGILDKALSNEIDRQLVDQEIARLGIDVSPESVLKLLADQPTLRNKDGSFNKQMFRQLLEQQRLTEKLFISQTQQDIAHQIILGAIGGVHSAPQIAVDALYKARAQKRVLDVVTIDALKLGGISAPDEAGLRDFYSNNPKLFTAPEYRSLTIATLSSDAVEKDITVTDEQVKAEYEARLDKLEQPERRDVVQVVVQDEAKAKLLAQKARASNSLGAAASAEQETAIPLDQLEEKNLMPELAKVVFSMHEGAITDPVKTQLGWHVLQLKKITAAGRPSYDKIKEKLRAEMRRDQAADAATRIVNQLDDKLAAGHSLDDIADGLKLRLVKIAAVDATGHQPNGKKPAEFPHADDVLKDAFAQGAGETSPVQDDKAGNYYVVRTDDVTPAGLRPFEDVKSNVVDAWKVNEQLKKAQALADNITKAFRAGKELSSFNGMEGVSTRVSSPLTQLGETDHQLPATIVEQAFKLRKGDTTTGVIDDKVIVARLASLTDPDMGKADPRKNMIGGEFKRASTDELQQQYIQHLRSVFSVKINGDLMNSLREQEN